MPTNSASPESHESLANADADATGQLDILDAEDILESDDIRALEAAAAGITSFAVATPSDPSGFEVGEIGELEDFEVEGDIEQAIEAPPPSLSTLLGVKSKPVPAKAAPAQQVQAAAIIAAIPPAPQTSPIPVESVAVESVVVETVAAAPVEEPAPASVPERTLEIKGASIASVAAAAAKFEADEREALQNIPGQTEVLHRSAMPSSMMQAAPARRPSSIAPVALDVATPAPRAPMASVPMFPPPARMPSYASMTPPKRGLSGLAIGVIAASALALVGLVGIGGYAASRAISDKSEPVAVANGPDSPAAAGLATEGEPSGVVVAPAPTSATNVSPASASTGSAIDVSALPTAAAPGAPAGPVGRGVTGRTSAAAAAAPLAAAGGGAVAPTSKSSGGALPPPGGGKVAAAPLAAPGAPLPPPPGAAPAAAPAPAPAAVSTTGTVRVDPNLRAVVVDGNFRRATDGVVVVTCGQHRIKAGMKEQQTVNVPCGGSVSL